MKNNIHFMGDNISGEKYQHFRENNISGKNTISGGNNILTREIIFQGNNIFQEGITIQGRQFHYRRDTLQRETTLQGKLRGLNFQLRINFKTLSYFV